jgi:periplasmic protein TonB
LRRIFLTFVAVLAVASTAFADTKQDWELALVTHLKAKVDYPKMAQLFNWVGITFVTFVLNRKGDVLGVRIAKPSGSRLLDGHTIRLVYGAQPFPAAPTEVKGDKFSFTVPIHYSLTAPP